MGATASQYSFDDPKGFTEVNFGINPSRVSSVKLATVTDPIVPNMLNLANYKKIVRPTSTSKTGDNIMCDNQYLLGVKFENGDPNDMLVGSSEWHCAAPYPGTSLTCQNMTSMKTIDNGIASIGCPYNNQIISSVRAFYDPNRPIDQQYITYWKCCTPSNPTGATSTSPVDEIIISFIEIYNNKFPNLNALFSTFVSTYNADYPNMVNYINLYKTYGNILLSTGYSNSVQVIMNLMTDINKHIESVSMLNKVIDIHQSVIHRISYDLNTIATAKLSSTDPNVQSSTLNLLTSIGNDITRITNDATLNSNVFNSVKGKYATFITTVNDIINTIHTNTINSYNSKLPQITKYIATGDDNMKYIEYINNLVTTKLSSVSTTNIKNNTSLYNLKNKDLSLMNYADKLNNLTTMFNNIYNILNNGTTIAQYNTVLGYVTDANTSIPTIINYIMIRMGSVDGIVSDLDLIYTDWSKAVYNDIRAVIGTLLNSDVSFILSSYQTTPIAELSTYVNILNNMISIIQSMNQYVINDMIVRDSMNRYVNKAIDLFTNVNNKNQIETSYGGINNIKQKFMQLAPAPTQSPTPAPSASDISGLLNTVSSDIDLINSSYSPEIQEYLTIVNDWDRLVNDIQTHTDVLISYGNLVDSASVDAINALVLDITDTKNNMVQVIDSTMSNIADVLISVDNLNTELIYLSELPSIPADIYTSEVSRTSTLHTTVLNIRPSLDDIKNRVTDTNLNRFNLYMVSWQKLFQSTIKMMASVILYSYMTNPTLTEMKTILDTHKIPDDLVDYSRSIDIVITESNNTMMLNSNTITDTNFNSYMDYINYIGSSLTSIDNYHTEYGSNTDIRTLILTQPATTSANVIPILPPASTSSIQSSSELISYPATTSTAPATTSTALATTSTAPTTAPSQSSPYEQPLSQDGPPDYTMSDTTKMMIIAAIILVVLAALSMICIGFVMGGSAAGNASATADSTEL